MVSFAFRSVHDKVQAAALSRSRLLIQLFESALFDQTQFPHPVWGGGTAVHWPIFVTQLQSTLLRRTRGMCKPHAWQGSFRVHPLYKPNKVIFRNLDMLICDLLGGGIGVLGHESRRSIASSPLVFAL